jgi:hypothetical protein
MTMAITVTIAKSYQWRMLFIGAACVGLGAWGVYDYAVKIPMKQEMQQRVTLLELCRDALKTDQPAGQPTPEAQAALAAVREEMQAVFTQELADILGPEPASLTPQQASEALQKLAAEAETNPAIWWAQLLALIRQGLVAERHIPLSAEEHPLPYAAFEKTQSVLTEIGQVTVPGKYDRVTQWAFIACLPCAPYFFWCFFAARRRKYILDDDGTLHTPQGAWTSDEIADIDMSRWMAKSVAWAVSRDGRRVKLDDYKYKGLHLIVGDIASRLYPDDWDKEAKPRDEAEDGPEGADTPGGADDGEPVSGAAADAR